MPVFDLVEKYLVRLAALVVVALVLIQGLMSKDEFRLFLSLDERLEGKRAEMPAMLSSEQDIMVKEEIGYMVIKVEDYSSLSQAYVLVNSQVMGSFADGRVKLYVADGDVIELDTRSYAYPVTFVIESVSSNLSFPPPGAEVICDRSLVMMGKVRAR